MFGLQPAHLIIILAVAFLLIAPSRLPELGRAVRKTMNEFRSGLQEPAKGVRSAAPGTGEHEAVSTKE